MDEILTCTCDHSNERYSAVLYCGTVYYNPTKSFPTSVTSNKYLSGLVSGQHGLWNADNRLDINWGDMFCELGIK